MVASPPDVVSPWHAADAFPLAPADQPYGYRSGKKLVPCTFDELEYELRMNPYRAIDLVWTPEHSRLVPPAESALLRTALRQRMRRSVHQRLRLAVIMLVSWGFSLFFDALPALQEVDARGNPNPPTHHGKSSSKGHVRRLPSSKPTYPNQSSCQR